jgi:hypothetical protein
MYYVYIGLPGYMPNDDPTVCATVQDARDSAHELRKMYTMSENGETFRVYVPLREMSAKLLKGGGYLPYRYGTFSQTGEAIYIGFDPDLSTIED